MNTSNATLFGRTRPGKSLGWMVCGIAALFFAAGSLVTAGTMHLRMARADSQRVFELNVYHTVPGKVPKLEERFRDASKLLEKHDLNVIAYWVPNSDPAFADTFIYIVAAPGREEMERSWDAFHTDPAFQKYRQQENTEKLIERVDSTYMRPTAYSAIQ